MLGLISSLFAAQNGPVGSPAVPQEARKGRRKKRNLSAQTEFTSYYGRPVVKKPHWVWPIWLYFWAGGISSGASAIATLAHFYGDKDRDKSIVQAGRYISMAGVIISPVLLIIDLQRPERFVNMLRVLKLRSPLSTGTWILTSLGILTGLNTARQVVEDGLVPENTLPGKLALLSSNDVTQFLQGLDGMALGTYTGVLLSATAVPLWANADEAIAPLFLSSAFSTGAAAISLAQAVSGVKADDLHRLDPVEQYAILAELASLGYAYFKLTPEVRKHVIASPFTKSFLAAVWLGMLGPLILKFISPKKGLPGRLFAIIRSLMVLIGGFFLRYAVIEAGKATADDPDAYHSITRGPARGTPEEQARKYSNGRERPFGKGRSTPEQQPNSFQSNNHADGNEGTVPQGNPQDSQYPGSQTR
jgi:formate-dependent nitrite reductase membrane component NrfD